MLFAMIIAPFLLLGQGALTITGIVEDESGAAIPGTKITLVHQDTNQMQETVAGEAGNFSFKDASPGNYLLRVEASGFKPEERAVTIGSGHGEPLRIKLKVGTVAQQVTVSADAADELSTSGSDGATTKLDDDLLRGLPTPSGDILPLIGLFVSPAAQGAEGTSIVVDGVEGEQIDMPSPAIRKVRINRNPYSAAFQHPGEARAEITTKRGHKSHYEGSFAMFARNSLFDAQNAFAESKPDLSRWLLQASLGGPFFGKRESFYIAGERLLNSESSVVNAVTLTGPLITNVPTLQRRDRIFARLQWWPSGLHTLFASYDFSDQSVENDNVGDFNLPEQGVSAGRHHHKAMLSYTTVLPPNLLNSLLFSFKDEDEHAGSLASAPAIIVDDAFTGGPSQTFAGAHKRTFDLLDTATYIHGRHSFLFGARFRTDLMDGFDASNFGGTFEFSSLAQFAAGTPYVFSVNRGDPSIAFATHGTSGFVQDEIRVRSQLTLTFGLRYDWQSTINHYNNFAPRSAFAFAPGKDKKTVVRGGVGIFHDNLPRAATQRSLLFDGVRLREIVIPNSLFPAPFLSGQASPPSITRIALGIRSPELLQASIGIDRELRQGNSFSLEYLFLHGVHLFRSRDINAPLPATGLRPEPDFLNIDQVESTAFVRSHALTATFRGRIGKFFKPYAQYVFSKTTNDTSGTFSLPANNYDLRPEIGPADFDSRHRFNLMGVLALPRGFHVGVVLSAASGTPFNITTGFDNNGDTVANDRPPGVTRNTARAPGTVQLDVRFTKIVNISALRAGEGHSRHSLEFNVDAFNVTNHTNIGSMVGVVSSPLFGRANSALPARTLELSARYLFRE